MVKQNRSIRLYAKGRQPFTGFILNRIKSYNYKNTPKKNDLLTHCGDLLIPSFCSTVNFTRANILLLTQNLIVMKKIKFLGVVAFAFLLSLNANILLDANNWDNSTEIAYAAPLATDLRPVVFACPPGSATPNFVGCLTGNTTCNRTRCLRIWGIPIGPIPIWV